MKRKILITTLLLLCPILVMGDQIFRIAPLAITVKSNSTIVTGTATAIPATKLKGRESMVIENIITSGENIWIGGSDVTSSNGFLINSSIPSIVFDFNDDVTLYAISDGTSVDVRTLEAK